MHKGKLVMCQLSIEYHKRSTAIIIDSSNKFKLRLKCFICHGKQEPKKSLNSLATQYVLKPSSFSLFSLFICNVLFFNGLVLSALLKLKYCIKLVGFFLIIFEQKFKYLFN